MGQTVIGGIGPDGKWRPAKAAEDGTLAISGGLGGPGGTGDASAFNQTTQITLAGAANTALSGISAKLSASSASFGSVQTSATGATYVSLTSASCIGVEIKNTRPTVSGLAPTNIEVRRGGSGATVCIAVGGADYFGGLTDASQLQIRRYDQSNTQVNVDYEVRS
jgi:hypothetical protein